MRRKWIDCVFRQAIFGLASATAAAATEEAPAVVGGPSPAGQIVLVCSIVVLFVLAFVNLRKQRAQTKAASAAKAA